MTSMHLEIMWVSYDDMNLVLGNCLFFIFIHRNTSPKGYDMSSVTGIQAV
jgi:hypothetical protein